MINVAKLKRRKPSTRTCICNSIQSCALDDQLKIITTDNVAVIKCLSYLCFDLWFKCELEEQRCWNADKTPHSNAERLHLFLGDNRHSAFDAVNIN